MRAGCLLMGAVVSAAGCGLVVFAGCGIGFVGETGHSSQDDSPAEESDTCGSAEGALPAPYCGEGACSCCAGCDPFSELCFSSDWSFSLGYGHCRSGAVDGTLQATIGGQAFVAAEVAAIASDNYVQVSGATGVVDVDRNQLAFQAPAQLGTFDCGVTFGATVGYASGGARVFNRSGQNPRPACSITLTAIGAVGERIEGTLAVTLRDDATGATTQLTDGAFSVERVPYP